LLPQTDQCHCQQQAQLLVSPGIILLVSTFSADLQCQVQDLQEASESASAELNRAERRINDLLQENENLQTLGGVSVEDIQAENQYLRQQVRLIFVLIMSWQTMAELHGSTSGSREITL
jgi:hypothetical protein